MNTYRAPIEEHLFCLYELLEFDALASLPEFSGLSRDTVEQILREAGRLAENVLLPLNRSGDAEGCRLVDGRVETPAGFREAYRLLCKGGWPSLTCDPGDGGQAVPHMINLLYEEIIGSANLSFSLYPGLTRGAYVAISRHGSDAQRASYGARLASGEWAGAMCLTEAQAGSDLSLLKTSARDNGNGSYAISGSKIFISGGDHDLTENIVYLVLARLPDAPSGTRGISLFLVPKFLADAQGRLGPRNSVSCGALESKMGIHGCSTCQMDFDRATGWLVGEANHGLKAMFSMMNAERLAVGTQGLSIAEASHQNAVAYARARRQGRAPASRGTGEGTADPIIAHPDVRRMLMTQRALVEGCRALGLWTARALDVAERHPDADTRREADGFVALMTPVVKAFLTDSGSEVANLGLQILGGHGYIRGNGQEQFVRDARVCQLYEGTNGIQALDLLGRKVLQQNLLPLFTAPVAEFIAENARRPELAEFTGPLAHALSQLTEAAERIGRKAVAEPGEPLAVAADFLALMALTALAYLWARAALIALARPGKAFHVAKLATARFFMTRILPRSSVCYAAIMAGSDPVMALEETSF